MKKIKCDNTNMEMHLLKFTTVDVWLYSLKLKKFIHYLKTNK